VVTWGQVTNNGDIKLDINNQFLLYYAPDMDDMPACVQQAFHTLIDELAKESTTSDE